MFAVRDLPRKVWDQQSGVADPADSVIQSLARGERLMTALVGKHP